MGDGLGEALVHIFPLVKSVVVGERGCTEEVGPREASDPRILHIKRVVSSLCGLMFLKIFKEEKYILDLE